MTLTAFSNAGKSYINNSVSKVQTQQIINRLLKSSSIGKGADGRNYLLQRFCGVKPEELVKYIVPTKAWKKIAQYLPDVLKYDPSIYFEITVRNTLNELLVSIPFSTGGNKILQDEFNSIITSLADNPQVIIENPEIMISIFEKQAEIYANTDMSEEEFKEGLFKEYNDVLLNFNKKGLIAVESQ